MYKDDFASHVLLRWGSSQGSTRFSQRARSSRSCSSPGHCIAPARFLIAMLLVFIVARPGFGQAPEFPPHHPAQVLVRFKPGTLAAAKQQAHVGARGLRVLREYHSVSELQLVEVPNGQVPAAIAAYQNNPDVLRADPDFYMQLDRMPNEPDFGEQWGMHNLG